MMAHTSPGDPQNAKKSLNYLLAPNENIASQKKNRIQGKKDVPSTVLSSAGQ
jgi:hypothetical protein